MKLRERVVLALALASMLALVPKQGIAADAEEKLPPAVLSKAYTVTLGHSIAATVSTFLAALKPVNASMLAIYSDEKIEVWVIGGRSSMDGAKETLEEFREKALPGVQGIVGAIYGVDLKDEQVTVVYLNSYAGNKEVLRRENGQYVVK